VAATALNPADRRHLAEETRPLRAGEASYAANRAGGALVVGLSPETAASAPTSSSSGRRKRRCCPCAPSSSHVLPRLDKSSVRSGLHKVVGDFGARENIYYGSIFLCMTLIVIVCFLVVNHRGAVSEHLAAAAMYDSDSQCELLANPGRGTVHQTGRFLGDRAIYTCSPGWEIVGPEERVCQADGRWSNSEPYCKKRGKEDATAWSWLRADSSTSCASRPLRTTGYLKGHGKRSTESFRDILFSKSDSRNNVSGEIATGSKILALAAEEADEGRR